MRNLKNNSSKDTGVFKISEISLGGGTMGICPVPGRFSSYTEDFKLILAWRPDFVITLTDYPELEKVNVHEFPNDLKKEKIGWKHFPIVDFGIPDGSCGVWGEISKHTHASLAVGGRVLCHCYGGCGRSGMVVMRLMCELGEGGNKALVRLRKIRECAVETSAQKRWAEAPSYRKF